MPDVSEAIRDGLGALAGRGEFPAAAYAVTRDGEVTTGGLGGADQETVFQIGSVTKALTGMLLADMAERGQVNLDDPATKYLPGAAPGQVTLLDLATHTSGLPRLPPGLRAYATIHPRDPYAWYPARRFLSSARRDLAAAPGGEQPYRYSNYGFGLLGHLLGEAAGLPYRPLLEQRICGPLGMRASAFDASPVQGHKAGRPVPPWQMGALAAAGGLHSTAADLGRLLTACLAPDGTGLAGAIGAALAPRRRISPDGDSEIGLAWHHALREGERIIWHNGMTGGFSAMVALNPARRTGAAILANSGGVPRSPIDALVLGALAAK